MPLNTACRFGVCRSEAQTQCVDGEEVDLCVVGQPTDDDANCDGNDNDCDGSIDEGYVIRPVSCGQGACAREIQTACTLGVEFNTCEPGDPVGNDDGCDGVDDDCDGRIDEGFASVTPAAWVCARTGTLSCVNGATVDDCVAGDSIDDDACATALIRTVIAVSMKA